MMVGTPWRMMVLVTGWTRICAESGTCLMQTTMCMPLLRACLAAPDGEIASVVPVAAATKNPCMGNDLEAQAGVGDTTAPAPTGQFRHASEMRQRDDDLQFERCMPRRRTRLIACRVQQAEQPGLSLRRAIISALRAAQNAWAWRAAAQRRP